MQQAGHGDIFVNGLPMYPDSAPDEFSVRPLPCGGFDQPRKPDQGNRNRPAI